MQREGGWGAEEVSLDSGDFSGDVEEADMVEDEALGILIVTGLVMCVYIEKRRNEIKCMIS